MSSNILARLSAVQVELAKIAEELAKTSTPQKSTVSSEMGAPVKARRPKKISSEELEQVKSVGIDAVKAINETSSEENSSEKSKKKRVISEERLAYLKSPEHIAKLKAAKEASKARKNAEKHAEELVNSLDGEQDDGEGSE